RVRRPTLFSLWRKARRENSAASRLLGSTSLRFALHGWQRKFVLISLLRGRALLCQLFFEIFSGFSPLKL
ncbi:hypothetical protein, partial [Thiolapillus sp.]